MSRPVEQRIAFLIPGLVFFLSGAASLIFEVLCARKLALVLGSTVTSSSATVASFLLGLGLGAFAGGKVATRVSNPIVLFSAVEAAAGVSVFLALGLGRHFQYWLKPLPIDLFMVKVLVGLVILLPPCFLMGLSLPILCHFYNQNSEAGFVPVLGHLYAINTLGAIFGVLVTDWYLVPNIGVFKSGLVSAGLYAAVAILAYVGSRHQVRQRQVSAETQRRPGSALLAILVLAGSGFCGLTYQVLWTRTLTFFNGNDVFSFSTTLSVYLGGIVLGSLLVSRYGARIPDDRTFLGTVLATLSLFAYLSLFTASWIRPAREFAFEMGVRDPWLSYLASFIMVAPSALLLGLVFPIASRMMESSVHSDADVVGRAYLLNTLGSAAGAWLAGLVLLPALGLERSFLVTSCVGLFIAVLLLSSTRSGRVYSVISLATLVAVVALSPDDGLLKRLYENRYSNIVYQSDDHYGSVALFRKWEPSRQEYVEVLYIDNFNMAGDSVVAKRYTTCLTLLASFLHPEPKRVLVICLGLGNTTNAALQLEETEKVTCVELSAKVVEAFQKTEAGPEILGHPKLDLRIGDGRNFLLRTDQKFDIISAEPPPPMNAGVVNLYSREYYELCRERLAPGGMAVQWLPVFQMSPFEARTIMSAFQEVFPYSTLWQGGNMQLVLIGSVDPIDVNLERFKERVNANHDFLEPLDLADPYRIASLYLADPQEVATLRAGTPPVTDDWPRIQYPDLNWRLDKHFELFLGEEPSVSMSDPRDEARLEEARTAAKAERYYEYANIQRPPLPELARLDLGRRYFEIYPDDDYFSAISKSSDHILRYWQTFTEQKPGDAFPWEKVAKIHYLHDRFAQALEAVESARRNGVSSVQLDVLEPLILLRGGQAGLWSDGIRQAREKVEALKATGASAAEVHYLEFRLDSLSKES